MTKSELCTEIAIQTGCDRNTILNVLESGMDAIKRAVADGDNVSLRGFGTFTTKTRATKLARNITRNTTIIVPEHRIPAFKPSDDFESAVRSTILHNEKN